jgi:hypothetical protein
VESREPDGPLTGAWEAVRRRGDGGEGGGGWNSGAERARAWRVENGGGDECGEEGQAPHPFIGSEGGAGRLDGEGDREAGGGGINADRPVRWGGETEE